MTTGSDRLKLFFTDAVMLAALSVSGYGVAYLFEVGYARHFGYPLYLISPTPSIIAAAFAVLSIGTQGVAFVFITLSQQKDSDVKEAWIYVVLVAVMVATGMVSTSSLQVKLFLGFSGMAFCLLVWFRVREKRARRAGRPRTEREVQLYRGNLGFAAASGMLAIVLGAQVAGGYVAQKQTSFFLIEGQPGYAVVRMYGDVVVAVKIDMATEQFTGEYFVGKFGADDLRLVLKRESFRKPRPFEAEGTKP